jgi:FlaG/FlaF family flagellin (archaellin)
MNSKRAVSTVIANVMMIAITLSMAAILIAWAGTTFGLFSSGSQIFYAERGQALEERFVVENVFFKKAQTTLLVYVRNVGVEQVNVVALYVNGTSLVPTAGGTCTLTGSPLSVTLPVGDSCQFNLTLSTWSSGSVYYVIVASARGNRATYMARAP